MNKRILIVSWSFYPAVGGMEQQSLHISKEFLKLGYSVDVLTEKLTPNDKSYEKYEGINIYRTSYQSKRGYLNLFALAIDYLKFCLSTKNKYDFAIIRGALTFEPIIFGVFKLLKLFNVRTFVTADTGGENDEISMLNKSPLRAIYKYIANQHDYLNGICSDNIKHYKELGVNQKIITEIPNGIDTSNYDKSKFPSSINKFVFLGRLVKVKGLRELLPAFKVISKKYPNVKLTIGGEGPERKYIESFISKHHLENSVDLRGLINSKDVNKFLREGDCLVQPSRSEGFLLVAYEAAVLKRALLLSDVSNLHNNFKNNATFFRANNIKDLISAFEKTILYFDSKKIDYSEVLKKHDIKSIVKEIIDLFNFDRKG